MHVGPAPPVVGYNSVEFLMSSKAPGRVGDLAQRAGFELQIRKLWRHVPDQDLPYLSRILHLGVWVLAVAIDPR